MDDITNNSPVVKGDSAVNRNDLVAVLPVIQAHESSAASVVPIRSGTPTIAETIADKIALRRANIKAGNAPGVRFKNGRGSDAISRLQPVLAGSAGSTSEAKPDSKAQQSRQRSIRPPAGQETARQRAAARWFKSNGEINRETFASFLPAKPYCTDYHDHGLMIRPLDKALTFRHVQINHPNMLSWIILDIDRNDAGTAWMDENLPQPNIIAINPDNGHGHYFYLLKTPVQKFDTSSQKALAFYAAIERGLTRRLKADMNYSGLMAKNPLHPDWRTIWGPVNPYTLPELDRWLEDEDKAPVKRVQMEFGVGRNCSIFDSVRKAMYSRVLEVKRDGGTVGEFREIVLSACQNVNGRFDRSLSLNEVGHIAKSIANWTWARFTVEAASRIQSARARKRWAGHQKAEPWTAYGMSERTYWRRKKAGTLPELPEIKIEAVA